MKGLLLDLNVWLDHCFVERSGHEDASRLVHLAFENDLPLLISASSLPTFFFVAERMTKAVLGPDAPAREAFAREHAWALLEMVLDFAVVVGTDVGDAGIARHLRNVHDDFEDDLILAAGYRATPDYFITNDRELRMHAPIATLSAEDWLKLQQA